MRKNHFGAEDEDLAAPLMHLGSTLLDEGRVAEAEMTIERAMKLTEKAYGGKDGRYGVAMCVLAQIKGSKGEFENALQFFRKGLRVIETCKDFKQDHASLDTIRMDVAALLTVMGREREPQELLKMASVMDKEQYAYYAAQQVLSREAGRAVRCSWRAGKIGKNLRHSLQLLNSTVGPDTTQATVVLQLLAALLHAQPDRQSEAEPLARESVRIREKNFGKGHAAPSFHITSPKQGCGSC